MSVEASAKTLWMGEIIPCAVQLTFALHSHGTAGTARPLCDRDRRLRVLPGTLKFGLRHDWLHAGDLSYWMDESFIYSLFVGMPVSPCLLSSGCLAFGGSASDDLCWRTRARTGVSMQLSASPHKTCHSFASLTLFHP